MTVAVCSGPRVVRLFLNDSVAYSDTNVTSHDDLLIRCDFSSPLTLSLVPCLPYDRLSVPPVLHSAALRPEEMDNFYYSKGSSMSQSSLLSFLTRSRTLPSAQTIPRITGLGNSPCPMQDTGTRSVCRSFQNVRSRGTQNPADQCAACSRNRGECLNPGWTQFPSAGTDSPHLNLRFLNFTHAHAHTTNRPTPTTSHEPSQTATRVRC